MNPILVPFGLLAVFLVVLFVGDCLTRRKVEKLRAMNVYPQAGKEKLEDVLNLLSHGEKVMAIRCYRSIYKVSLKEAKEKVEKLVGENA